MHYFDASALAKRYVREKDSARVRRLLSEHAPATSRLSPVEIVSALMRRSREGTVSEKNRERALAVVEGDLAAMLIVELTPDVVTRAQMLLRQYPLRAGDAIQLASCLQLQGELVDEPVVFVAFDVRLIAAADAEGVKVA